MRHEWFEGGIHHSDPGRSTHSGHRRLTGGLSPVGKIGFSQCSALLPSNSAFAALRASGLVRRSTALVASTLAAVSPRACCERL